MAKVQVIQRHAHLAGAVRLDTVNGREGKIARAVFTAISNTRRAGRSADDSANDAGDVEATAIQWTLWGRQAENAAAYLCKGSHVNVVGHVRNNNYPAADGGTVYALAFTADEVDYLDNRTEGDARRERHAFVDEMTAQEDRQAADRGTARRGSVNSSSRARPRGAAA